jgi:antitoxin (DNA-binding transcriptional repressor) of toxin-antitoxin stability system
MSATVSVDEAQVKLREIIHQMAPGQQLVITENQRPVATLIGGAAELAAGVRPPPGLGKGFITVVSNDDEHLEDFAEYMP